MTRERIIRFVAGSLVLTSIGLGVFVNPWWLALAAFVGANLVQSSITRWCLLDDILAKFGVSSVADACPSSGSTPRIACEAPIGSQLEK